MGFVKTKSDQIALEKGVDLLQQTYEKTILPKGANLLKINVFPDDQGGWFKENLRIDADGNLLSLKDQGIEFKIRQSNMSYVGANGKRFWHIHPEKGTKQGQNEIWTTNGTLLVGLVDLRKKAETYGVKTKVILSPDRALFIPSGVAHGFINPNNFPVTLVYFTDQCFEATENTQEHRIDPTKLPFDFVESETM